MANFKTHFIGGAVVSGFLSTSIVVTTLISPQEAMLLFVLGTIGGLLPDIDSNESIPLKVGFLMLSISSAFIVMFAKASHYSIIEMVIVWILTFFFFQTFLLGSFKKLTVHRGVFHSIPASFMFGFIFAIILYHGFNFNAMSSWFGGFFITIGYITHLVLDELYSIDLFGRRLKKSFGTALKFYDKRDINATLSLYIAILFLFLYTPNFKEFKSIIQNQKTYFNIYDKLIPKNGWFRDLYE